MKQSPHKLVFLVRHGESDGNVRSDTTGVIHGRGDASALTQKGKEQIVHAAHLIKNHIDPTSTQIWYSPTVRTTASARIMQEELMIHTGEKSPLLYDINFGAFEGKRWQDLRPVYKDWYKQAMSNRYETAFPEGESLKDIHMRLHEFMVTKLLPSPLSYHLLITHEEAIRAFLSLKHTNPLHYHQRDLLRVTNGSVSSVLINDLLHIVIHAGTKDSMVPIPDSLPELYQWYTSSNPEPDEFFPNRNYSDNDVYTARSRTQTKTVKCIPASFIDDVKKDIALAKEYQHYGLKTPDVTRFEKARPHYLLERKYIEGTVAEYWLRNTRYAKKAAGIMGSAIKTLHKAPLTKLTIPRKTKTSWVSFITEWMDNDINVLKKLNNKHHSQIELLYKTYQNKLPDAITFLHNDVSSRNLSLALDGKKLILTGIWDFERSLSGDPLWDLGVTQKISFLHRPDLFKEVLGAYFGTRRIPKDVRERINVYTTMNTTGAIRYRFERGRQTALEETNLTYVLQTFFPA